MKNYIKDKKFPILLLVALLGIIFCDAALFNNLGYEVGKYFVLLLAVFFICLNIEHSYYFLVFCFPFANILKLSNSGISLLPLLYLIIIFKLIIKNNKLKTVQLFCFLIFTVMQFFCVIVYQASFISVISFLLNCFFVIYSASYFLSTSECDKIMLKNSALFLAISIAFNIFLSEIFTNIPYIVLEEKQEALVLGKRFAALIVEPNEFSQIVIVAIGFLIATFSLYKTILGKVGIITLILYLGVNGIRSNSKSYVLTLMALFVVLVLILVIRIMKNKVSAVSVIGFVLILAGAIVIGAYLVYNVIIPVFEFRSETSDLLTGRDDIWKMYVEALFQRIDVLLIGCGAGNATSILALVGMTASKVPHNMYLEYLVEFGIVGILIFLLSWSNVITQVRRKNVFFLIPTLAFLITSFGISSNANDCIYITFLLLTMPGELNPKVEIQNDQTDVVAH